MCHQIEMKWEVMAEPIEQQPEYTADTPSPDCSRCCTAPVSRSSAQNVLSHVEVVLANRIHFLSDEFLQHNVTASN